MDPNPFEGHSALEKTTLALALGVAGLYLLAQWSARLASFLTGELPPFLAFVALTLGVLALSKAGLAHENPSKMWFFVHGTWLGYTIGVLLRFLSEVSWALNPLLLGFPRHPSIADAFWFASFLPFLAALLLQAWPFREAFSGRDLRISLAITTLTMVTILTIAFTVAKEFLTLDFTSQLVALAYLMLDLLLLFVAVPIVLFFRNGTYWRPFMFIMLGIILNVAGDVFYAMAYLMGTYYEAHPLNLLYVWSYLAVMLGFYERFRQFKSSAS